MCSVLVNHILHTHNGQRPLVHSQAGQAGEEGVHQQPTPLHDKGGHHHDCPDLVTKNLHLLLANIRQVFVHVKFRNCIIFLTQTHCINNTVTDRHFRASNMPHVLGVLPGNSEATVTHKKLSYKATVIDVMREYWCQLNYLVQGELDHQQEGHGDEQPLHDDGGHPYHEGNHAVHNLEAKDHSPLKDQQPDLGLGALEYSCIKYKASLVNLKSETALFSQIRFNNNRAPASHRVLFHVLWDIPEYGEVTITNLRLFYGATVTDVYGRNLVPVDCASLCSTVMPGKSNAPSIM